MKRIQIIKLYFGFLSCVMLFTAFFLLQGNAVLAEEEASVVSVTEEDDVYYYDASHNAYVKLDASVIPDATLRAYLDRTYGTETDRGDRVVPALDVIKIDLLREYGPPEFDYNYYTYQPNIEIRSLQGIEFFPFLSSIRIGARDLSDVDFGKNTYLTSVQIIGGSLGTLDFRNSEALESLSVSADSAKILLGEKKHLVQLFVDAPIESIQLENCPELSVLSLEHTKLTSVDVKNCEKLKALNASFNPQLESLKLPSGLLKLWLHNSGISALDLSSCPVLCFADIAYSGISSLSTDHTALAEGMVCLDPSQALTGEAEAMRVILMVRGAHQGFVSLDNLPSFDFSYWKADEFSEAYVDGGCTVAYEENTNRIYYDFDTLRAFYHSENGKGGTDEVYWMSDAIAEDGRIVPQPDFCFSDLYECYGALTSIKMMDYAEENGVINDNREFLKLVYDAGDQTIVFDGEKYLLRKNMEGQFWAIPLSAYLTPVWAGIEWIGPDSDAVIYKTYCPSGNPFLAQLSGDTAGSPKAFLLSRKADGSYAMREFYYDVLSSEATEDGEIIMYDYQHPKWFDRGALPGTLVEAVLGTPEENALLAAGEQFASYEGFDFYKDSIGDVRCFSASGAQVINDFKCDGTYTYYFQADGTAMKDRLTYHPDGVHIIYFDGEGHEVFSDFANVKKTIAGEDVNDFCFFDVYGYMYVDVVTYDKTGTELYYANAYGVLEMGKWFQFSNQARWADGRAGDEFHGGFGYAKEDGTLLVNQETYDWENRPCYLQGNGVALYKNE